MSDPRKSTAYQSLNPGCQENLFDIDILGHHTIESTLLQRDQVCALKSGLEDAPRHDIDYFLNDSISKKETEP